MALKFLPEELGSDPQALERFSREARTASSLDHPNICTIYEFGEHEGQPFMVMQLLEGQTLRDRLAASEGSLPLEELLDIGIQISDGLQAAHERGIIHRDIKPANIFITDKGVCKILDFGVAKLLEMSDEDEPAGTTRHSSRRVASGLWRLRILPAPESRWARRATCRRSRCAARSWMRAPTCSPLAWCSTRWPPASAPSAEKLRQIVRDAIFTSHRSRFTISIPRLPPELETIINKALEKDRQARYQTAAEMGADLKRLKRGAEPLCRSPRHIGGQCS